jgi:hypothetical protein
MPSIARPLQESRSGTDCTKRKMAEEAGAAPAVPDEGNTCLANKRDDLASRLSSAKEKELAKWWCPRRELHPHCTRFELAASAIGLRGQVKLKVSKLAMKG